MDERLAHAKQAVKQLGTTIPWLVDLMDNRLKHALGDRPNSEFLIDPKGKIVRKRAWSHPGQVRKDLEDLVGKVDRVTREEDVKLNVQLPVKPAAERGFAYSAALRTLARRRPRWDAALLDRYIADPEAVAPRTSMNFHGISDRSERAALILYLRRSGRR